MKIISHRGYWKTVAEKNTITAFERSFEMGYGTETDVRDCGGELLVSHDMPNGRELRFADFIKIAAKYSSSLHRLTLALNIKADGMAATILEQLNEYEELDCFVFDMSVPDMRSYFKKVPVFTRMSEVEQSAAWIEQSEGVWLDAFTDIWYDGSLISALLETGKRVCVVSNELHGRPHLPHWELLSSISKQPNLILCTDFPEDAAFFFGK